MNRTAKMTLAALAMVTLTATAFARGGDCSYGDRGGMMGGDPAKMEQYREKHLATLHDKLKLSAEQETAWKKFASQSPMMDKNNRPDWNEMKKLNAPQRMEKMVELHKAMDQKMTEHLAVLKEFYATLTPEQQKIFDEQTPPHDMHGHRGGK